MLQDIVAAPAAGSDESSESSNEDAVSRDQ